jgi:SAM-dependent methyltransferase
VEARLPLPAFRRILDLCCGPGRHARWLFEDGYDVTGLDRDPVVVDAARRAAPGVTVVCMDAREIKRLQGPFDGILILWQSFGYFSEPENVAELKSILQLLRPGGRLLLDVFHPDYFRTRQGVRSRTPHWGRCHRRPN